MYTLKVTVIAPGSKQRDNGSPLELAESLSLLLKDTRINANIELSSEITESNMIDEFYAVTYTKLKKGFFNAMQSDVDLIWCMRGGYGSYRLSKDLACTDLSSLKPIVIGYSDITAIHLQISLQGKNSIYWNNCWDLFLERSKRQRFLYAEEVLRDSLYGHSVTINIEPINRPTGIFSGVALGGNLSLLVSAFNIGDFSKIDDKIVFLEDINENFMKVDRNLYFLEDIGFFNKTKAILFGAFINNGDNNCMQHVLKSFLDRTGIPGFHFSNFGHVAGKLPIVFMRETCVEGDKLFFPESSSLI